MSIYKVVGQTKLFQIDVLTELLDEDFYVAVYCDQLKKQAPADHFLANYKSLQFDPRADLSLKDIAQKFPKMSAKKILQKLAGDQRFLTTSRSISDAVFLHFDLKPSKKVRSEIALLAELVDGNYYFSTYSDVAETWLPAHVHYGIFGALEGRNPTIWFDSGYYTANNPDVSDGGINPLIHYIRFGKSEGRLARDPSILAAEKAHQRDINERISFDGAYYLFHNPDVANSGVDPLDHYLTHGSAEGRSPNAYFDPIFYLGLNADVRKLGISPFQHYCDSGVHEDRLSKPTVKKVRSTAVKPLLFIGHDGIQAGSEVVLLEIIRWYYEHTLRPIKVLLLSAGPLANQYAEFADVYVLPDFEVDDRELLEQFVAEQFEFLYVNTVVSGAFFKLLRDSGIEVEGEVVTHIHEMQKVLAENTEQMIDLLMVTSHWISASPLTTEALTQIYEVPNQKISTIEAFIKPAIGQNESPIDARVCARAELGLHNNAFVVAGCGTVYWRKGPDIFLAVARNILERTRQEFEFVWIGPGPDLEHLRADLTAEEAKKIRFVGPRSNSSELLAAADVFFLSSREDPFPLVVMESAQYGVPTVCFGETTGVTRFIGSDAGICLPKVDVEDAADALIQLEKDRPNLMRLGDGARGRVFNQNIAARQCLKIHTEISAHTSYKPSVSVVVPFYNHGKFAAERMRSIQDQTIKDIEILVLDDCSTDNTRKKIEEFLQEPRLEAHYNDKNSGSAFAQWEKGTSLTQSEIVWVAEGDDSCSPNFLEVLLGELDDPLVNIASCRTEVIDEKGELVKDAMAPYLERAYPRKFEASYKRDGFVEVDENLGAMCTLVNASGLLFRKSSVRSALKKADGFKMCGDWFVYLNAISRGKLVYRHDATNYFRRHSASIVNLVEGTPQYFKERQWISEYVVRNFYCSEGLVRRMFEAIDHEWLRFNSKNPGCELSSLYDKGLIRTLAIRESNDVHVAFYVHGMRFSSGGIERLSAQLANELVSKGYTVTIYCRFWGEAAPIFPLLDSVRLISAFDENHIESGVRGLKHKLRTDKVDVFIPMLSEKLFEPIVAAVEDTGIPVVVSEHNDPDKIVELWWDAESRNLTFKKASGIHLILEKFKYSLPQDLQQKISIIPNFISPMPEVDGEPQRKNVVLSVGRLTAQKRFDRLISAFGLIAPEIRDWELHIYGDGELRDELLQQIESLGLAEQVFLKGNTCKIDVQYHASSIFVLPSEFEAFGLVVAEAQQAGMPAVAYEDCNGPNELIEHRVNGLLASSVNPIESLATSIHELIKNPELRKVYGERSQQSVQKYQLEHVCKQWEKLILQHARERSTEGEFT